MSPLLLRWSLGEWTQCYSLVTAASPASALGHSHLQLHIKIDIELQLLVSCCIPFRREAQLENCELVGS